MRTRIVAGSLFVFLAASAAWAQPLGTAFTYQGRLTNAGQAASGLHDFRFRLFDAATGGTPIGSTLCADNIAVQNGLFTTSLDFGPQFATGAPRHLKIEVRADTGLNCANASGFIALSPRQQITAAPFATHAITAERATAAFALSAPDGSPASAVFVDNAGSVGIGTTGPLAPLHVASPVPLLFLQDSDSAGAGQVGLLSFRNSSAVETGWLGFGSSGNANATFMNNRVGGTTALGAGALERLIVTPAGSVGIGTASPLSTLDVRGNIRFGSVGQFFPAAGEENLRIVRGVVTEQGAALAGAGWTMTHTAEGVYDLTFTASFTGLPAITATIDETRTLAPNIVELISVTPSSARFLLYSGVTHELRDNKFHFIAVGPR